MDGSLSSLFMDEYNPLPLPQTWTPPDKEGELQRLLVCAYIELESARVAAHTQSKLHEERLLELEQVLKTLRKERDEARQQFLELFQALSYLNSNNDSLHNNVNNNNNNNSGPLCLAPLPPAGSPVAVHERDMDSFSSASMASPELPEQQLPWAGLEDLDSDLMSWKHPSNLFDDLPHLDFMDGMDADLDKVIITPNPVQPEVKSVSSPVSTLPTSSSTSSTTSSNNVTTLKRPLPEVASPIAVKKKHLPEPPEANMAVMLRSLPERGKFLQAVMQAGPLLQNLLVAGPLPQWRHPPPVLEPVDIPKVTTKSPIAAGFCSNTVNKTPASLHHHHHMPREISWGSPFQYAKIH